MKKATVICTLAAMSTIVVSVAGVTIIKQNKMLNTLRSEKEELKMSKEKAENKIIELEKNLKKLEQLNISAKQEVKNLKEIQNQKNITIKKEKHINKSIHFNPNNLLEPSNLTKSNANKMLSGTSLQPFSEYYINAEKVYGINAIFLMSLTSLESGYGESNIAINKNNIGGIRGNNGGYTSFSSKGSCINYIAKLLSEYYLKKDSEYFNGYSVWNVSKNYCEQGGWADEIVDIANNLISKCNK